MKSADYNNQLFKQVQDLIDRCDSLSADMKRERKEHKKEINDLKAQHVKEIHELRAEHKKEISELNQRVEKLEVENTKLKNDNDRLKKIINNDSNNSSKPPSSDIKKNIPNNREKTNKKAGGQKGHKAHFLSKKSVEEKIDNKEIEHVLVTPDEPEKEYISKYVLDLDIKVIAKEYRFYKANNGRYNIPKEFKADVQYGSNLKTMCTVLNTEGIVALDRLANFVSFISGGSINISKGTIVNFTKEFNRKSQYLINEIRTDILNSELLYTDATTSRCENRNVCVRTHSTEKSTLLVPTYKKSKKCIEETGILNNFTGNLVHDHETVMYNYGDKHVECNVHISRYLRGNYENTQNKWSLKMRAFLCSLNEYRKNLKEKGVKKIEKEKLRKYSQRYDEIIEEGYLENKKTKGKYLKQEEKSLLNRLKKYKENHLMFLYIFSVPFDNNLSERDLRHIKSKQKISGHFNSFEGLEIYSNIKSIIGTLKKRGKEFYILINNVFENIPVSI